MKIVCAYTFTKPRGECPVTFALCAYAITISTDFAASCAAWVAVPVSRVFIVILSTSAIALCWVVQSVVIAASRAIV